MRQATRNPLLFIIFVGFTTMVMGCGRGPEARKPAPQPAATGEPRPARKTVSALGRLQPRGGVIDIGGMAGERVDRIMVEEGDKVTAGQILAYLGSYPLRQSELQLAELQRSEAKARSQAEQTYGAAMVAEAETTVEELKLAELDVQALQAKIDALQVNLKIAQRDSERIAGAGDVVSPQERDHQQLVVEQAKAELGSTQAQLAKLQAGREMHEREAQAKLRTARANFARLQTAAQLDSLDKAVAAAEQKLELSLVRAPRDGHVLRIVTRVGEIVGPRPLLKFGDTDHMGVTAEIYETDIYLVQRGQKATVTSNALPAPLTGTVESIGRSVAKNDVMSLDPTAAADARVVLATIRLDDSAEASGLVDLQVDVIINTAQPGDATQANNAATAP